MTDVFDQCARCAHQRSSHYVGGCRWCGTACVSFVEVELAVSETPEQIAAKQLARDIADIQKRYYACKQCGHTEEEHNQTGRTTVVFDESVNNFIERGWTHCKELGTARYCACAHYVKPDPAKS